MAAMQRAIAIEAEKRGMTPAQFQAAQRAHLEAEAQRLGIPFEEYINRLKMQAYQAHQQQLAAQQAAAQQQQQQQGGAAAPANGSAAPAHNHDHQHNHEHPPQQGQQVPINPTSQDPRAVALAAWLRTQPLKSRVALLQGQRKDMFKGVYCPEV
jgi:translocation protein SEC62